MAAKTYTVVVERVIRLSHTIVVECESRAQAEEIALMDADFAGDVNASTVVGEWKVKAVARGADPRT